MAEAFTTDKHGPTALSNAYADLIASDGANKHAIRTIAIVNTGASTRTVQITIGAGAAATEIVEKAVLAHDTITLNGFWIVPTSTAVQGKQDAGADVTVTLSGYHVV